MEKNKVKWLLDDINNENLLFNDSETDSITKKKHELEYLKIEDIKFDNMINDLKIEFETILCESDFKSYGYVTFNDLKLLTNEENINLLAIKAPLGTRLEVPDPEEINKIYEKTLKVYTLTVEYDYG